jgi:hypothetical protein
MSRRSERIGLTMLLGAAFAVATAHAQKAPDSEGPDISGVWWASTYSTTITPMDGGELPFTPEGKAAYEETMAGLKSGTIEDKARTLCLPDGVPRLLETPYPFQIVQTRGQVAIIYEMNHAIRLIDMAHALESEQTAALPYYDGHSAGHWEGDVLVVETAGYNDKTFLDATGAPHSDAMRTVERIRRTGDRLEDVVTVTDPANYTRPWSARFVYDRHPEVRIQDYVCGEPHRDLSGVAGVKGF